MVICMKTTIQISDALFEEAKNLANQEHTSLRKLVEEGLRKVISEKKRKGQFRLRKATFAGKGLQPEYADASWEKIRDEAYKGRGA
jgi:hypothetical protein